MRSSKFSWIAVVGVVGLLFFGTLGSFVQLDVHAEDNASEANSENSEGDDSTSSDSGDSVSDEITTAATNISISPVSQILAIEADMNYEDSFKVSNDSNNDMEFEVYAAPYSYTYSEEEDTYKLGFNNENAYTQIVRWITFKDSSGAWVKTTKFTVKAGESVEVQYKISTPSSIPAGGQYAVLFAHTLSGETTSSGIKVEASPGLVIYGRSTGDTVTDGEISALTIKQTMEKDGTLSNIINASAKIKNTGNVDFMAKGTLRVTGIFGRVYYETPTNSGRTSVIPESEIMIKEAWDDTPFFGLFNVEWIVDSLGQTETISSTVLIMPPIVIIIILLLLTIIIVWIIIMVRKRRERRSKFMV